MTAVAAWRVDVYKVQRGRGLEEWPRWSWRLFIAGERICTGPQYETKRACERVAKLLRAPRHVG